MIVFLAVAGLLVSAYFVLRTPVAQTWLTQRIAAWLSDELNTRVEVEGVDIEFFKKIVLEGFYAEDLHHDTLIYAGKLKVDIARLSLSRQELFLHRINLENGKFFLKYYKGENELNLNFILNLFVSNDTTPSPPWLLRCENIQLKNVAFRYRDESYPAVVPGVNYDNINVTGLNGGINNIIFEKDTLFAELKSLAFKDKSGFVLDHLSCSAKVASNELSFKNIHLKTFNSDIHADYGMYFTSYDDFSDFINKVQIRSRFGKSSVAVTDIAFFAPVLFSMNKHLKVENGEVRGTISNLKGKKLDVSYGNDTHFKGNLSFSGLPEINETYIDLEVEDLRTSYNDLITVPVYPFESGATLELPSQAAALGNMRFNGEFTGFFNDFVAYGVLQTALGKVSSDMNLKHDSKTKDTRYSGRFTTTAFNLGKLLSEESMLGQISVNANINGRGLSKETLVMGLVGTVSEIELNKYNYKNIDLKGHITGTLFEGSVNMSEENVDFNFNGSVNYSRQTPVFNFTSEIRNARLDKLHLLNNPLHNDPVLSTRLSFHFTGISLNDFEGVINIDSTVYSENGNKYKLNKLELLSSSEEGTKYVKFTSDIADASIKGDFKPSDVVDKLKAWFNSYFFPENYKISNKERQDFEFSFFLKKTDPLTLLFAKDLSIGENAIVAGYFNSDNNKLAFTGKFPSIKYKNYNVSNFNVSGTEKNNSYTISTTIGAAYKGDSILVNNSEAKILIEKGNIDFGVSVINSNSNNKADIKGSVSLNEYGNKRKFHLALQPSVIHINNSDWALRNDSVITIDSSSVFVSGFSLTNNNQYIYISGNISANPEEQLEISMSDFGLDNIKPFLGSQVAELRGTVNGKAFLSGLLSEMKVASDINITNIVFNGDSLGRADIHTDWDEVKKLINIDAGLSIGNIKNIEIKGQVGTEGNHKLNLDIMVQKVYLNLFDRYVKEYISDLRGIASAGLHVEGTLSDPQIEGTLKLQKTSFLLNYLNTSYNFTSDFNITSDQITINNVKVNDVNGNPAIASGRITHRNFRDFKFDLDIRAENFQALNTTASQNSLYYGTAFMTGLVQIKGTTDNLVLNISGKPDKGSKKDDGTKIYIPLSNPEEVATSNFITFITKDTVISRSIPNQYQVNLSGIQMNFDLEVNPNAEVQLIFDSKIGDIMKGRGTGNIKMEINTLGNFNMYGDFIIEEGDYLLTFQNLISKRFLIEKGGVIQWNGDPYDADIKLNAIYKLKASLSELLNDSNEIYRRKIPVECHLILSEKLLNPNTRFEIRLPGIDGTTQSLVSKYLNNNESDYKQIFSLLVLNKFARQEDFGNASQTSSSWGVTSNVSEFVSSQFNNWLSQIDVVGINFNLDVKSKDAWEAGGSIGFLDDRITVDGKVSNSQQANNSNLVGEGEVEVKASKDGKIRLKFFNRANNNLVVTNAPYTRGVGIFYREEFDKLSELIDRYRFWRKSRQSSVSH